MQDAQLKPQKTEVVETKVEPRNKSTYINFRHRIEYV